MASKTNSGDNLGGAIFFPGILGRVLVISNSKIMKILNICGIYENPDYGIGIGISIGIYIYIYIYIIFII